MRTTADTDPLAPRPHALIRQPVRAKCQALTLAPADFEAALNHADTLAALARSCPRRARAVTCVGTRACAGLKRAFARARATQARVRERVGCVRAHKCMRVKKSVETI